MKLSAFRECKVARASEINIPDVFELATGAGLSYWPYDDYLCETKRHDSIFLVAMNAEQRTVGFIVGRVVQDPDHRISSTAELYNIGVKAGYRRFGIGSKLISEFVQFCRGEGVSTITLEVRATNKSALDFYFSQGFEYHGLRKGFYGNPPDDAILMQSTIK